jgi:DNA-binding PadR family transcriptional regulator
MEPMSAARFFKKHGGGSSGRVDRHFKKLAKHGWLRLVRVVKPGAGRRGGEEHIYRATELAVFDDETWALLPYSLKVAFSWRIVGQLAERIREAMEAGAFDAQPNRHLTWTPFAVDRLGWERIVEAANVLFASLFEEQEDAKLRMQESGAEPLVATVGLLAFESATPSTTTAAHDLVTPRRECGMPFPERLARVFADELALTILTELNMRAMSVKSFQTEFGGSEGKIRRLFKQLEEAGWIERVAEKTGGRRRGSREQFYRATGLAIFDNETWQEVPSEAKHAHSWTITKQLLEHIKEAVDAGSLDSRDDRHLTWSLLRLDKEGWDKVAAACDELFAFALKERDRAADRLAESGDSPIMMTLAVAAFESAAESSKEW